MTESPRASRGRGSPPSEWAGARPLGGDVYWRSDPDLGPLDDVRSILVWHWCDASGQGQDDGGRWVGTGVCQHTLVTPDPLHLEPSLLWRCCGRHGFVRGGKWVPA